MEMLDIVIGSVVFGIIGLIIGYLYAKSKWASGSNTQELNIQIANLQKDIEIAQQNSAWIEENKEKMLKDFDHIASKIFGELMGKIKSLDSTTSGLVEALKSPITRGRWGESQLKRVVELAGLMKHVDFTEQASTADGRPDMIAYLPNEGILPVDAKASMSHYLAAIEENDEDKRKYALKKHADAVKARIKELSQKRYWDQFEKSPECVVMFVPIEPSLGAAFEIDSELFDMAMQNRILICTPVTLLALLKAVAYGWQQHKVTENVLQIASDGKLLYERLQKFIEHLSKSGQKLDQSVEAYNEAIRSLNSRLIPAVRRFQDAGLSNSEIESPNQITSQTEKALFVDKEKN
jgi:DNA recombination protein RmuC